MKSVIAGLIAFFSCWGTEAQNWEKSINKKGGFSVSAPCTLKESQQEISTPVGLVYNNILICNPVVPDTPSNYIYMVSWIDYPDGSFSPDSSQLIEELFKESADAAAGSVNGKLMYQEDFPYYSYPGRIWRISYNKGQSVLKSRSFLKGDRLFILSVATKSAQALNKDSDTFFESFRFL